MRSKILFSALILTAFIISGCASKKPAPISPEDNPEHHYLRGMQSLEKGNVQTGKDKFKRSLYLDSEYSPAQAGMALALGMQARKRVEKSHKNVDISTALNYLDQSLDNAENKDEEFIAWVTAIRTYTQAKPEDWLEAAEENFAEAEKIEQLSTTKLPYYQDREASYYFMGQAYMQAYKFREAEDKFARVLSTKAKGKWQPLANKAFKKVQKIVRAGAHHSIGNVAKKIAVKDTVDRADMAALLVDEINLHKLFAGRISVESELASQRAEFIPADIVNSPFKPEIKTVLKWNVRGLTPTYAQNRKAYLFHPSKPLTRKQLALILEDILIKLTGEDNLASKYVGTENSPFVDVTPSTAWFNAIMTVTSRGLMEPELSSEFKPNNEVSGAELLQATFKLRDQINIY